MQHESMLDIDAYLARIGYHGSRAPTAATLRDLHRAHMLAVPFENLDIHTKRPIELGTGALFDKIVRRRRGGFCYELNGLFAELLRSLGYDVTMLSAGVARDDGSFGPEFDHLTLLVQEPNAAVSLIPNPEPRSPIPDRWLADVGFGDSFREPLRLVANLEQPQDDASYRLDSDGEHWLMMRRDAADWHPQYRFTLQPHAHAEYADMCRYHQTSPDSSFTQRRMCSLATPTGRITIANSTLITTENGHRTLHTLADETEVATLLRERFGVDLTLE